MSIEYLIRKKNKNKKIKKDESLDPLSIRACNTVTKDRDFQINSNMHAKRKGKMLESGFETSRLEYPHPSNTPRFRPVVSKNVLNKNGSARLKSEGFQEGH